MARRRAEGRGGVRFQNGREVIIGGGEGEADDSKNFVDPFEQVKVTQHKIAFGEHVYRIAHFSDHFQRLAG